MTATRVRTRQLVTEWLRQLAADTEDIMPMQSIGEFKPLRARMQDICRQIARIPLLARSGRFDEELAPLVSMFGRFERVAEAVNLCAAQEETTSVRLANFLSSRTMAYTSMLNLLTSLDGLLAAIEKPAGDITPVSQIPEGRREE